MGSRLARAALALVVLGAAWSATLGGTLSAYTGSTSSASYEFTAAPDWVAPTADIAAIGRTTAYDTGSIKQGASYYVYSEVGDTGNPASGTASVATDVNSITSGHTAVALTAGTYDAGGATYNYRSTAQIAATFLAAGSYSYTITSTDNAGNARTQSFTTIVDNTAPSAADVQSSNSGTGTVGHLDQGDTLTLTYSGTIDPYSVLGGWTGAATTGVLVKLVDGGTSNDTLAVYTNAATPVLLPLGTINLSSRNYLTTGSGSSVTYGASGAATPSTMTRNGASITLVLGSASGASSTNATAAAMTWTPSASATDIAGNDATTTTVTQSGAVHVNF